MMSESITENLQKVTGGVKILNCAPLTCMLLRQ